MIPDATFQEFIRKIVASEMPDELDAFDYSASQIIADVYQGHDILAQDTANAEFQLISETVQILGFIQSIHATYKILSKVVSSFKSGQPSPKGQTLEDRWIQELQASGLGEAASKAIASKFGAEMRTLVELSHG
ncbi:MAG: hypothetical protein ACKV2Q_11710 [Planctomycetaceae bacterium]